MLTSSPHMPRSATVSPRTFHYGPCASTNRSTHMAPSPASRRSFTKSATSSPSLVTSIANGSATTPAAPASAIISAVSAASIIASLATGSAMTIPCQNYNQPMMPLSKSSPGAPASVSTSTTIGSLPSASPSTNSTSIPSSAAMSPSELRGRTASPRSAVTGTPSALRGLPDPSPRSRPQNHNMQRTPQQSRPSVPRESTLSPNKRRGSPTCDNSDNIAPSSQAAIPASPRHLSTKRARPSAAPVKVLPLRYELCHVEDIVTLIAHMLSELIETNDSLALRGSGNLTRFHSRTSPGISVCDYLNRLAKHATLTPPLLLSMVYYIDRLCALYPDFTINTLTVHRFLITAATVAAKGLSDSFWNNSTYARVGGVRVNELKMLELEFLYRVDWKIVPNPEVLVAYYTGLVERCPGFVLQGAEEEDELEDEVEETSVISDDSLLTSESGSGAASDVVAPSAAPSVSVSGP